MVMGLCEYLEHVSLRQRSVLFREQEARGSEIHIFWNVWVLLTLPAVWLAWYAFAVISLEDDLG